MATSYSTAFLAFESSKVPKPTTFFREIVGTEFYQPEYLGSVYVSTDSRKYNDTYRRALVRVQRSPLFIRTSKVLRVFISYIGVEERDTRR